MARHRWVGTLATLLSCLAIGCKPAPTTPVGTPVGTSTTSGAPTTGSATAKTWPEYPDVPYLDIMSEVDGIELPRLTSAQQSLQLEGAIPADVGNKLAASRPGEKATGDWLRIRFNSEPKVLNSIIESSAVEQYISMLTREALLRQNPETFEFEPHIASKWVTEDSIKLSPDYAGKECRVAPEGGQPTTTLEFEYAAPSDPQAAPPKLTFVTQDKDGQPLGQLWVGVYPVGRILGAPTTGYHQWSDEQGKITISGIPTGKYTLKVGSELYGLATKHDDGSLTVTAGSAENPLTEVLKAAGSDSLTLKPEDWIDIQQQTYFTFYLRPEVKWSDGTPFTTKDLEFGYTVINNTTVDGEPLRVYYQDLVECRGLTPHVVRMRYRQQYFKALEFTTGVAMFCPPFHLFERFFKEDGGKQLTLEPLTKEQEEAQNKVSAHGQTFGKFFNTDPRYNIETPLGTGPYVKGQWVRDDRLELNRNPDYWLPERAAFLDKIVVRFIPDNTTAMQAFKAGDIDFFWNMTPEQYFEDLKGNPEWFESKYVKASWFSPMFNYFGYNMLQPQLQDRRVRIALSLLFDKQDFLEKKLYNAAAIVSGSQYYFGPGYDHEVAPLGYDPETARDLLAEAGWVDTDNDGILDKDGLQMRLKMPIPPGNPVAKDRVELFQKSLKTVGIELEVNFLEWASFIDKIRSKDFDICTLSWATPVESDPFQIWHSSGAGRGSRGSNHVSFNSPLGDELIEMLRLTLDEPKRQKIHFTFHRLTDAEQPYTFLYCVKEFGAYPQRFRGVKWYRLRPGFDLTEWYVPKDEQMFK
jgi:peptide/nickel transport system substrate-binding protein